MSVLTLDGKAINWSRPPKRTDRVMWSRRDMHGRAVTGSLFAIAHLDYLDGLAVKKYNTHIVVIQPPYNSGVAASAGTHDFDFCYDWYIPGVSGNETQRFARANGLANWYRKPPTFSAHQHGFAVPPQSPGFDRSRDFLFYDFRVGFYVDGGWSLHGARSASSQIEDYYEHRTALAGHAHDPSWFPPNIAKTIFNLDAYIARKRRATAVVPKGPDEITNLLGHAPLARLGGEAGEDLWEQWEASFRSIANENAKRGVTTTFTVDSNKRPGIPNFGAGTKRIGGVGIDLIAKRQAKGGAKVKVIKRRKVNLHIDGHDCYGVKVKVTFPSGKTVTYWDVVANLGRGVGEGVFERSVKRIRAAFGRNAVYNFMEIDEADKPEENKILRGVFHPADFKYANRGGLVQTLVGERVKARILNVEVKRASSGLAKVSPMREMVAVTLGPK